ncbi:MAG: hypothetical protein ACU0FT_04240 [Paracoccus sp. (in: a-proteobacteria)]|uniref:hypothetical protein n=1 Tax=Paracoccus sp. TaxID=267 RepID=UPI004058568F
MTIEVFQAPPLYTIQGVGPYAITCPYTEGAIRASVVTETDLIPLDAQQIDIAPANSATTGNITLQQSTADLYAGAKLLIERETRDEQGWAGVLGEREAGLEAQLDTQTMALQELRQQLLLSVRSIEPVGRLIPENGRSLIFDGQNIVPGPTADQIENAQALSEAAALALSEAVALIEWSAASLDSLLASNRNYPVGARIVARAENLPYEVVTNAPRLLTAGGTGLRPLPRDGAITARQCGIPTTGDQTALLQQWGQWACDQGYAFDLDGQSFTFSKLDFSGDLEFRNGWLLNNKTVPDGVGNFQTDFAFRARGTEGAEIAVAADFEVGHDRLTLASTAGIQVGDLLHLNSSRLIDTDHRGAWQEGQMVKVAGIVGNVVHLAAPLCYSGRFFKVAPGTISSVSADRYTLSVDRVLAGNARDRNAKITITSGAAAGEFRYAIATSNSTLRHSGSQPGEWDRGPWPAGVQAGDTYEHAWRSTVTIIKPARVVLRNITMLRDKVLNAVSGSTSFRGLRIELADAPIVEGCTINNFAMTNIHLSRCFRPVVRDCDVSGANLSYNQFNGTGYGVSVEVCSEARVIATRGMSCRRVVDYSGSSGYSEYGVCEDVTAYGGGRTYTGADYWPAGDQQQSVVGSHGSGRFTEYRNCMGVDCYLGVNLRGRSETVTNYRHFGLGAYAVNINYGCGHVVDGVSCEDRFTEERRAADFRQVISTNAAKRLEAVAFIDWSDPFSGNLITTIRNVRARAVSRSGLVINGTGAAIRNLVLENWHLTASSEGTTWPDFALIAASATATLDDCVFSNVNFALASGGAFSGTEAVLGIPLPIEVAIGGKIKIDDFWVARLAFNDVVRFPCRQFTATVDIRNMRKGTDRPRCNGLMIQDGNATALNTTPDASLIDILAGYPSTGTSTTSGSFGLNLNQSQGFLSVASNIANEQTFLCRIS